MLREKDTSLEHRSLRLQSDLALGAYDFDRRDRLIDAVTQLQKQDLLAVYDDSLLSNDSRRLIIQATGNGHGEEALDARNGFSAITDITAFKEETPGFKLGE
jgi:secreted Zn-dependent insulinase-like peptidase